ncbi:MAG: PRTRC system protein E [Acidobacteriia bacterium]|nr:PRTRC system protein E [Terriglobia bacterium]
MFKELEALLARRSLTITVATLAAGQIRVNVIPHSRPEDTKTNEQIKYTHKDEVAAIPDSAIKALTTPISLTGTAEEIDAKLADVLLEFVESHTQLQATFDRASTEISDAVKAIDERNKNKAKVKTTASKAEQKEDPKVKADDKPKQDETLPLWWTNPSVPPPGAAATHGPGSPTASGNALQANSQPTTIIEEAAQPCR